MPIFVCRCLSSIDHGKILEFCVDRYNRSAATAFASAEVDLLEPYTAFLILNYSRIIILIASTFTLLTSVLTRPFNFTFVPTIPNGVLKS